MLHPHISAVVVTCEHASKRVPAALAGRFVGAEATLRSHRGWDIFASDVAGVLARAVDAPASYGSVSRLVLDLNRSVNHRGLFSEFTRDLSRAEKDALVSTYYTPYRDEVSRRVRARAASGRVLHLSVHSFTPQLNGKTRRADIGLLYDPGRCHEKAFCAAWRQLLLEEFSAYTIRRNYPYLGVGDGHVASLRRELSQDRYLGIELEINQKHLESAAMARQLARRLCPTILPLVS